MFSGDRKIPTRGSTVPVGNEACRVSHWTVDRGVGIFLEPLNTNDRFFFSYTTTVRYSTVIIFGDVTELDVYSQWRALYKSTWNSEKTAHWTINKWLFHRNGFTRTSLSATVARVSNFVEKNVCVFFFLHQGTLLRCIQSQIAQQLKYVNRNALSIFKALY